MFGFLGGLAEAPRRGEFFCPRVPYGSDRQPLIPAAFAGVFSSVEARKRAFLDTASQCSHAGITFCPLVIEAGGGRMVGSPPFCRVVDS